MYLNLLLSIICASFLFIVFKYFSKYGINRFQGIVINYFTAATFSFLLNIQSNLEYLSEVKTFFGQTIIIGFLFISVFYITALTTQKLGLAVASVTAKMSVVIPVASGMILFDEKPGVMHLAGILVALTAVYFITLATSSGSSSNKRSHSITWLLPVVLFIGTGLVDASVKYAQAGFMNESNRFLVITFLFGSAGSLGLLTLGITLLTKTVVFKWKNLAGGLILGLFNFFSLFFLVKCLDHPDAQSAVIFPMINVGVVLLSTFYALLIFKEKLTTRLFTGIVMAIAAIVLLTVEFGN
ncbi:MAG: EamA/RhaT family transporter [Bacteroidia bacterium]|nr:EamA/RhaT family transporter [Bacteroidia bacterium]MCZ2277238.1 EamA/RhaT family transporter [Bacteroidia bacterium]